MFHPIQNKRVACTLRPDKMFRRPFPRHCSLWKGMLSWRTCRTMKPRNCGTEIQDARVYLGTLGTVRRFFSEGTIGVDQSWEKNSPLKLALERRDDKCDGVSWRGMTLGFPNHFRFSDTQKVMKPDQKAIKTSKRTLKSSTHRKVTRVPKTTRLVAVVATNCTFILAQLVVYK